MGKEFRVIKELATVSATAIELAAVNRLICAETSSVDFHDEYGSLLSDIVNTYQVVLDFLQPVADIQDRGQFDQQFATTWSQYEEKFNSALSEPRINAEFTFEKYLQFRKRKEVKTNYPPLKAAFTRLHDFIDKWIDNDIWLAMSIDLAFKQLRVVLGEVDGLYKGDPDEAYALYQSSAGCISEYLSIIASSLEKIRNERAA